MPDPAVSTCDRPVRVGYFGPEGTFTQEALIDATRGLACEPVSFPTIYDTVMGVRDRAVSRALVPIENSLEGSVNATLDALAIDTREVAIVGEVVHPIRHCLIACTALALEEIEAVVSHPQATAQCARFIRNRLPQARIVAASSTAEAVRTLAGRERPWAALGNRLAAERYGCQVLEAGVQDVAGNETRFVWLARADARADSRGALGADAAGQDGRARTDTAGQDGRGRTDESAPYKTAIVFWGAGSEAPGWLVACLSEFAARGVNLTRIESRPRKQGLGRYMFFLDLEGQDSDRGVAQALSHLSDRVEVLRVLGSFPAATQA